MLGRPPRRRARARLTRERLAATAMEHLDAAVVACDASGHVCLINARAREDHRAHEGPRSTDGWAHRYAVSLPGTHEALPADRLPLSRALRGEQLDALVLELRTADGTERRVCVAGGPLLGRHGRRLGAMIVLRDISDEHRALEVRLVQDEILSGFPASVALVSASDGILLHANDAWNRMLGYGRDELLGRHISVITAIGESQRGGGDEIGRALERHGAWSGELESVRKDGTQFWTATHVALLEHPVHGRVWVTVLLDISDRHAAQRAVAERDDELREAFEHAPVGIALLARDQRIVDVNKALSAMTGRSRDALVGTPVSDLTHPEDRPAEALLVGRLVRGEIQRFRIEQRYVNPSGVALPVAVAASTTGDPVAERGGSVVVVVEDLRERPSPA